jgi:hypothetical protein
MARMRRPRDYPANRDDFDVTGPGGKIVGRIFKSVVHEIGCGL